MSEPLINTQTLLFAIERLKIAYSPEGVQGTPSFKQHIRILLVYQQCCQVSILLP